MAYVVESYGFKLMVKVRKVVGQGLNFVTY